MVNKKKAKQPQMDLEIDRRDLKEALQLVKLELKRKGKNEYYRRKNRIRMVCGSREHALGRFSTHHTNNYSTSCNLLLNELRYCVGQSNWSCASTLIQFLLKMNGTLMHVIWRTSLLVLLYHENASHQRLNDFLEQCLGLVSVVEKRRFLRGIFSIDGVSNVNEDQGNLTDFGFIRYSQDVNQTKLEIDEEDDKYSQFY